MHETTRGIGATSVQQKAVQIAESRRHQMQCRLAIDGVEIAPHGATYISVQIMLVVMVELESSYKMR